jgi:hypothetical protein
MTDENGSPRRSVRLIPARLSVDVRHPPVVMARLDRAICKCAMVLSDGPVEPGHDVNGESQLLSALVLILKQRQQPRQQAFG